MNGNTLRIFYTININSCKIRYINVFILPGIFNISFEKTENFQGMFLFI